MECSETGQSTLSSTDFSKCYKSVTITCQKCYFFEAVYRFQLGRDKKGPVLKENRPFDHE